jgi:two-component system, NtrC family, sensor histidine kinase HydH
MTIRNKYYAGIIIASVLLLSYFHYSPIPMVQSLHGIYAELYVIPLLLGALRFGVKGAIITFLFVSLLYLPHVFSAWTGIFLSEQLLSFLFLGLFTVLAGLFVDHENKYREQLGKERYLAVLGQATTTIVHDLRNPIVTILGFARRIQEKKGDSDAAAEAIIDSAEGMQKILNDALDFAKPIQLELKEQDLGQFIKKCCEACKFKADEVGALLTLDIPAQPVMALIDDFRLERAIANLITNAIEASSAGQNVHIRMTNEKSSSIFSIQDNGPGMDRNTLENIFIPFYTKKSYGTGLGLPIAKKIIEGHKGEIVIDSKPGLGTKVKVYLPNITGVAKEKKLSN